MSSPEEKPTGPREYVAGMSEEELRRRRGITEIIKLGSNENPLGAAASLHRYPPMTDDGFRSELARSTELRSAASCWRPG